MDSPQFHYHPKVSTIHLFAVTILLMLLFRPYILQIGARKTKPILKLHASAFLLNFSITRITGLRSTQHTQLDCESKAGTQRACTKKKSDSRFRNVTALELSAKHGLSSHGLGMSTDIDLLLVRGNQNSWRLRNRRLVDRHRPYLEFDGRSITHGRNRERGNFLIERLLRKSELFFEGSGFSSSRYLRLMSPYLFV